MEIAKQPLVISTIGSLWNTYMSESANICVSKHFLKYVDDKETRKIIQYSLNLSEKHIQEIQAIFNIEDLTIPDAFSEADVNLNAPRLFTDSYYSLYIDTMSGFGMDAYSLIIRYSARPDITNLFVRYLNEATDLFLQTKDLRLRKGTYLKAPRVEVSKSKTYIEKEKFFSGILGKPRPLIAREITNIFAGITIDIAWRALSTGFGQVTKTKQVREFMFKGTDITSSHFKEFGNLLNKEEVPVPSLSDEFVTSSITAPFSEKLMMFLALMMSAFAIGVDGAAIASSTRSDLIITHSRFGAEIIKYASDGMQIMVDNRWLEQPPQAIMHENLSPV